MATSRGQITIVDLNDGKTVNLFLSANHPTTQVHNQDGNSYVPDYTVKDNALVITPELLISDVDNPVFASQPTWTINGKTASSFDGASVATTSPYALTINKNMVDIDYMEIKCEGNWYDSDLGTNVPVKAQISFDRRDNTGQLCFARIDATGHYFKKEASGVTPSSIVLTAVLVRGSGDDTTPAGGTDGPFSVTWQRRTTSGWTALTTQSGKWTVNSNILTVYPNGVDSMETFRAVVKDTYSASASYNKEFPATFSILDLSDPFSLVVSSSNGTTFVNGNISTTLTARVQMGGYDVDETKYNITYKWTKFKADETQDTTFGTKTTKSVDITGSDVDRRATFFCEATISE